MFDPRLSDYIKQARAAGMADADIKKALTNSGWPVASVDEAFAPSLPQTSQIKETSISPTISETAVDSRVVSKTPPNLTAWILIAVGGVVIFAGVAFGAWYWQTRGNGEASPVPVSEPARTIPNLTFEQIKNATYFTGILNSTTSIPLKDGSYVGPPVDGTVSRVTAELRSHAFGDLNGDGRGDAVAILAINTGGSGTFYGIYGLLNNKGTPENIDMAFLGDRVIIRSLSIDSGKITLDMVTHGPNDGLCCPARPVRQAYKLQGDELVKVSEVDIVDASTMSDESHKQARDAIRIADLAALKSLMGFYMQAVPGAKLSCLNGKISKSDAGSEMVDGTGWVQINFSTIPGGSPIVRLPIDPLNKDGYVYSFACNERRQEFEFNARFESDKFRPRTADDKGNNPNVYETGMDLGIIK